MLINFQTGNADNLNHADVQHADKGKIAKNAQMNALNPGKAGMAMGVDYRKDNNFSGNLIIREKEKGKSLLEIQQEAENVNVPVLQDYMTVMSNTMSGEDYAQLEKEGFHFRSMSPDEAVTIVDKIKAELASSGTVIAGYNDDINVETLTAAVGSETLARAVADAFQDADLPLTKENIGDLGYAWELAKRLTKLTDGSINYMIDRELEPKIWDLYLAQNSGMDGEAKGSQGYFRRENGGYLSQESLGSTADMQDQIDRVIQSAGMEMNEGSRASADWILERGLPLTAQNLIKLEELRSCPVPVTEEIFAKAAANAVSEGKKPVQANLSDTENIYKKAVRILNDYTSESKYMQLKEDITARRQLEEIRFRMTAEVNVKLLKSNFAIDTAPMEELVSALRKAEEEIAKSYFPGADDAVDRYHLFNDAQEKVAELPALPADILGTYNLREVSLSLEEFHREGTVLKDAYIRANESYEALMTAPRADLGDNIRKAFANVDNIVKDLGLPASEENRRAVRILGYNRMEITEENVEKVRMADEEVQNLIRKMTPAMTLKMIRDGVNPLEKSIEELNDYFDGQSEDFEKQAESYSRFLYRMERRKEITEDERESYIGVFRLIRQIEKTDGAAVGALINSQAEVQFSNLLSAVRSRKFKGLDVKIEDAFGTISEVVRSQKSITDQILSAFTGKMENVLEEISGSFSFDTENEKKYDENELEMIRNVPGDKSDVLALLEKGEMTPSADNLLAANALLNGEENLFTDFLKNRKDPKIPESFERIWEKTDDKEELIAEYCQMLDEMEQETDQAVFESENSVDVRRLSLLHKQISVARHVSDQEEYFLPMEMGGRVAQVHLTVEHSEGKKGLVSVSMNTENGEILARFSLAEGRLDGFFVGNDEKEVTKLKEAADIVTVRLTEGTEGLEGIRAGNMSAVLASSYVTDRQSTEARQNRTDGADDQKLYRIAKLFLQAVR